MSKLKGTEVKMENDENVQYFSNIPQQFEKKQNGKCDASLVKQTADNTN